MAVVAWRQAMRLVFVYTRADAQLHGSTCMALGSANTLADAQSYGSRCIASVHAFRVCVYAG